MFLQNVSKLETDYTVPHLRKQQASVTIVRTSNLITDKMFHKFLTVCVSVAVEPNSFSYILFNLTDLCPPQQWQSLAGVECKDYVQKR
jgi:hypothetical protein